MDSNYILRLLFFISRNSFYLSIVDGHGTVDVSKVYPNEDSSIFKAGTGSLKRFRDRRHKCVLSIQRESFSAATKSVKPFKEKITMVVKERGPPFNPSFQL